MLAGYYKDPLLGRECCLILDWDGVFDGDTIRGFAKDAYPDADVCLVRSADVEASLEGFEDQLYYIELSPDAQLAVSKETDLVSVRPSSEVDKDFVLSLLVEAFEDALELRRTPAPDGAAASHAISILDRPDAVSFVAEYEGQRIGHVLLLDDQVDDVTGEHFVEFLDILVPRGAPARTAAKHELTLASHNFARSRGKALIGHVVARPDGDDYDRVLLNSLAAAGWATSHKFLVSPLR